MKMNLYYPKMDEEGIVIDSSNTLNELVFWLTNGGEYIKDEEYRLLLLASLPKFYKLFNSKNT